MLILSLDSIKLREMKDSAQSPIFEYDNEKRIVTGVYGISWSGENVIEYLYDVAAGSDSSRTEISGEKWPSFLSPERFVEGVAKSLSALLSEIDKRRRIKNPLDGT